MITSSQYLVQSEFLDRGVVVSSQFESNNIKVHKFITTPAQITITKSKTTNLGNYNSQKEVISITVPCYKEQIEQTYQEIEKWLEEKSSKKDKK